MDRAHLRLKQARINAGFDSAKAAADRFNWNRSTYGGHENAQNSFKRMAAEYGRAFGVSAAYLLWGEGSSEPTEKTQVRSQEPVQTLDPERTAHVISALLRRVQADMSPEDADLWARVVIERALQSPNPADEPLDRIQTSLLAQFGARKLSGS